MSKMIRMPRKTVLRRLHNAYEALIKGAICYPKNIYEHHNLSFSQEGEDCILQRIFERNSTGFYVDVGSHHPQRFSNTYRFYLRGWRGINIDPIPGGMAYFDKVRPRDINLEMGISNSPGKLLYYAFEEAALNTFDPEVAKKVESTLMSKNLIQVLPLADVLDLYLDVGQHIDFLSVDAEGFDLTILQSNDWSRYRPSYVLAEALEMQGVSHVLNSKIHEYMCTVGYELFAKSINTLIYANK
jgi:hypothetical protein